jgi:hypothetical protein
VHRRRHGRGRPVRGRELTARPRGAGAKPAGKATTHILRASWKPRIYRDVEIESEASLRALAEAIVASYDFDFDHAFGFYDRFGDAWSAAKEKYELFADMEGGDSEAGSVEHTAVGAAFPAVGKKLMFLFDYGDEWRFTIEFVKPGEKRPSTRYPRLLVASGEAPVQYGPVEDDE